MSYGLTVFNSSSLIQIGENYSNYYLLQEGIISVDAGGAVVNFPSTGGPMPLIATRASTVGVAVQNITASSVTFVSGSNVSVPYRIYAPSLNLNVMSGFGLIVKNTANEVVFNSQHKQLRVLQLINYTEVIRQAAGMEVRTFPHALGQRFVIHSHMCVRRGLLITPSNGALVAWLLPALVSTNNNIALTDAAVRTGQFWSDIPRFYYEGITASLAIIGD